MTAPLVLALVALAGPPWTGLGPQPIVSGPYTGRVSDVVASRTDPNLYFCAGADGGVWRTRDGGTTWTPLTDALPTSTIGALALAPSDERIVWAGTGEANFANHSRYGLGLYRSTDGGDTWSVKGAAVFAGRCISRIVVHPTDPARLWVAVTTAGGFPALAAARLHPQRAGPLGVFRSTDAGETWTQLSGGLPTTASATDLVIDPSQPDVLHAAIGDIFGGPENGVYRTTDGGSTWSRLGGGLPASGIGRIALARSPSNPARLFAVLVRPATAGGDGASTLGIWRTDDAGTNWTQAAALSFQSTYGWYLCVATVHPTSPDTVIVGGLTAHRSTNAGGAWTTITPPHVDVHAFAWDSSGRLLCGNDGGLHRSLSQGSSWQELNRGLGLVQFYAGLSLSPVDPNVVLGGLQDNGTCRRSAATQDWAQGLGGDGGWTQIHPTTPTTAFAEYQGTGSLFRSTNGGASFGISSSSGIVTSDRNCFLPPYLIDLSNPSRMIYGTHRVYQSLNGGQSWTPLSGDLTGGTGAIRALALAPTDPLAVYAATNDGRVLSSSDGGAQWTLRLTGNPGWPRTTRELSVHPQDARRVYLAGAAFGVAQVRRSTDAGASWTGLDGDLPDVPVNTVAVHARPSGTVLYAGSDDGVWRSNNEGLNWIRYGDGLPRAAVVDLIVDAARSRLVAGTQGRGAWSVPLDPLTDFGPVAFATALGLVRAGTAEALRASDNRSLELDAQGAGRSRPHGTEVRAWTVVDEPTLTALTVSLEARVDAAGVNQELALWNRAQARWDVLDTRPATLTDSIVRVAGVPNPSEYLDPVTRRIEARARHEGAGPVPSFFAVSLDQLRFEVTY